MRPAPSLPPATKPSSDSFHPGELWLDTDGVPINAHGGGLLYWKGNYYWYGEFKTAGPEGNTAMAGVSCYSSPDLYHWKNEGIALAVDRLNSASPIAQGCIIERPKVIYNRGASKFVMWFHHEMKGYSYHWAHMGAATSDAPTGPFHFEKSFRLDWQMSRDMTLFQDDDGRAYHLRASEDNWTLHIQPLSDDYLSSGGDFVRVFPGRLMEAPTIIKHGGRYHMINSGCTGWAPNPARYATAGHILGPWSERGNPCHGPGAETTFDSQGTYLFQPHDSDTVIFLADRWNPENPIDGRYVWLPVQIDESGYFHLEWKPSWSLQPSA